MQSLGLYLLKSPFSRVIMLHSVVFAPWIIPFSYFVTFYYLTRFLSSSLFSCSSLRVACFCFILELFLSEFTRTSLVYLRILYC